MNIVIAPHDIDQTDLRGTSEIWLTEDTTALEDARGHGKLCLWRAEPVVSHDMLSEGTHEQNLRKIWLMLDSLEDADVVRELERKVREQLARRHLDGEFYPAEVRETHH